MPLVNTMLSTETDKKIFLICSLKITYTHKTTSLNKINVGVGKPGLPWQELLYLFAPLICFPSDFLSSQNSLFCEGTCLGSPSPLQKWLPFCQESHHSFIQPI